MRRRAAIILIALAGSIVALIYLQRSRAYDPVYQGKPLHYWLKARARGGPDLAEALKISREAGPEAVPLLCDALHTQDNLFRIGYRSVWTLLPRNVQQRLPRPITANRIRRVAARMLGEMGTNATSAIPALTKALNDPDMEVQSNAAATLRLLNPPVQESGYKMRLDTPLKLTNSVARQRTFFTTNIPPKRFWSGDTTRSNL